MIVVDVVLTSTVNCDIMILGVSVLSHGNLAESNTRYSLTLPKEVKRQLEIKAKAENRSLNNLILTVLLAYLRGDNNG